MCRNQKDSFLTASLKVSLVVYRTLSNLSTKGSCYPRNYHIVLHHKGTKKHIEGKKMNSLMNNNRSVNISNLVTLSC